MDIKLQPAGLTRDPYLYDNIGAKMRQMTVDLWLLRTKVAEYVKDWKAMENYGRQAHKLAGDLRWEPFVAQCALPIGIALFNQGEWFGAYENFEEAEKTQGYYLAPETISVWQRLAAVKADCSAQRPSVPALASNPTPASISKESRLYDPGRRLTPSPRMRAKNALSKTAPNVPESDPIAPTAPPLETYHQNPISPTSSESASPPPRAENELALLSANYDRQSLTELPPTSESEATFLEISPRVPTTTCISHPNLPTQDTTAPPAPPIFPRPPPGSQTLVPTPPPPNPQSPGPHAPKAPASPTSHRSAIQAWESAQVESEINTITDTASPLVRSAGSAILHWPRPPSRSIVQRPRSRRGSIYTKRPGFGRAISDGGVPVTRERPDRPRSWGPVGGAPPSLSQGSTPLAEGRGNSAVPDIPARTNPSIKWADEYTKPVVVARREQSVGGKAEEGSKQDRASEHEEGSEKGGSEHEAGREKESEHSGGDGDDRSETSNSEEGGVKLEDGKSDV